MGKPKKANVATIKNVNLEKQITEGKVAKPKKQDKIKLRAEETPVCAEIWLRSGMGGI